MLHSSPFRIRKTKNMTDDFHAHKSTIRHRFRDVSHMKLTDIFKSLRRRRLRSNVPELYSLPRPGSFTPPPADYHSSPVAPPSPDILSRVEYRSDAVSILSSAESDCLSGMSTSGFGNNSTHPVAGTEYHLSPRPFSTFATSPSLFQLRSSSTRDYLVDRLEEHLRQLSLEDASLDPPQYSLHDIEMDVCSVGSVSLSRSTDTGKSSCHALPGNVPREARSSPRDETVVPMILITSVDAKHVKPLSPSTRRSTRTPFGASNVTNQPTHNVSTKQPKSELPHDDPFTTQPRCHAFPPDYNLTFRLPAFPVALQASPVNYSPETPTPMCCGHSGDCRGDLWEVLHPPLVAGRFTLPPFKLPPLSAGLFSEISGTPLPY